MLVVGMDEVGRGCWAGPLVAGAVILPTKPTVDGEPVTLRDSKRLSKRQREVAAEWIHAHALAVGLGWVGPREIDKVGIVRSAEHG
jgi:ribonuclease HII